MTLERGALLYNRYRILDILGQGGMGSIYRAVDDNLGLEVAVKENLFTTDEYARQFRREATILAGLRHQNLPRVSDHFVIDEHGQYLVMDYIEGEDLREHMDRMGVVKEAEALIIGVQICEALSFMHMQNPPILHRDIKPGNVKITPEGNIFLVDFGLAKAAFTGQRTTTGARAMTPGYSPPEQYGGARTDNRSDIYSLAATLYAAMAGVVPEDSLARTMEQAELTPLRDHNPNITRRFSRVVEKALSVHPNDRYQTADEFKGALNGSTTASIRRLAEEGTLDPKTSELIARDGQSRLASQLSKLDSDPSLQGSLPISPPIDAYQIQPISKPRPKRRRGCFIGIVLGAILMIIGGGVAFALNPTLPEQILGGLPFEVGFKETETSTASPEPTSTESEPTEVPTLTATNTPTKLPPSPTLTPALTFTSELGTLSSTNEATITQTLEPSSTNTLQSTPTITSTPTIKKTSTPTKSSTPEPTETNTPTATPTLSVSGQIAFASIRTDLPQIFIMNLDGTNLRQLTNSQLGACQPDWSPDGSQLVFISPCEKNQELYESANLFIINADGSGLVPIPTTGHGDFDPAWSPDGRTIAFTSLRNGFRPQVHFIDLESGETHRLSSGYNRDYQPEWLSDGSRLVFVTTRNGPYQIWVMNFFGGEQVRFSASRSMWNTSPVFSPNGEMILYTQVKQGGIPYLMVARYPEGAVDESRVYPPTGSIPMREANYSPDGTWLVFESWPDGALHDIYIMKANGDELSQLTFGSAEDFDLIGVP